MRPRPRASYAATRAEGRVTMGWKSIVTAPWSMSWRTCEAPETKWRLRGAVRTSVPSSSLSSSSGRSRATRNS